MEEDKNIESTRSPFFNRFLHQTTRMDTCIIKNDEGRFGNCHREVVYKLGYILRLYALTAYEPMVYNVLAELFALQKYCPATYRQLITIGHIIGYLKVL